MGNRQLRISDKIEISKKLFDLKGKKIQVVLETGAAYFGIVRDIVGENVVMENMLNKKVTYPVKSLSEIYIDSHT
jgi:ATP phosphoribosyltransferase